MPNTKRKGDIFERRVRRDIEAAGLAARRIVGGAGDPGDVIAAPWLFECKHQRRPSPIRALEQAEELAASDLMAAQGVKHAAAVVQRHGDRKGPTVTMRWQTLLGLLAPPKESPAWKALRRTVEGELDPMERDEVDGMVGP